MLIFSLNSVVVELSAFFVIFLLIKAAKPIGGLVLPPVAETGKGDLS